jgi:hypothetical protein
MRFAAWSSTAPLKQGVVGTSSSVSPDASNTMSDFRTAFRTLRGHPAFSAVVILTMAVGVAANTAIFSVYGRLVLHPVTIPDPSSLVAIWFNNPQRNVQTPSSSVPRYEELRAEVHAFSLVGLSAFDSFLLAATRAGTRPTSTPTTSANRVSSSPPW